MGGHAATAFTAAVMAVRWPLSIGLHPASATAASSFSSTTLLEGRTWGRCLHDLFLHSKALPALNFNV